MRRRLPLAPPKMSRTCDQAWADLSGDDTVRRHCEQCGQTVINLSALSAREVRRVLKPGKGPGPCVAFVVEPDGRMRTRPEASMFRNGARVLSGVAAVLTLEACEAPMAPMLEPAGAAPAAGASVGLGPNGLSPFSAAVDGANASSIVRVSIDSEPAGANVTIDGKVWTTPASFVWRGNDAALGRKVRLVFEHPNYETKTVRRVIRGRALRVRVSLAPRVPRPETHVVGIREYPSEPY